LVDGVNKKVLPLPSTTLSLEEENNHARSAKQTELRKKKKTGKNFLGLDHKYERLQIKGQLQLLKRNSIIKTDVRHQEKPKGFSI